MECINLNAAGIDVGSRSHYVAVAPDRDPQPVQEFSTFTADLERLADWLQRCGITTVAMESTGVYWIPLFELLESRGFEVKLVNSHHVKNVPGRKTDVLDCQWIQQLHTFGLLSGSFRPDDAICVLRAHMRQRDNLARYAGAHIQHMQKALNQMNIQLHHVVSDLTGVTGMKIIRAILAGERDPQVLAEHRDRRCKNPVETIAKALQGNWREEHLFALRQALELFDVYQQKIHDCDQAIAGVLDTFEKQGDGNTPAPVRRQKRSRNTPDIDLHERLFQLTGVDLTRIDALNPHSVLKILSETGTDMTRWPSAKQFASWLGLSPGNRISGGKRIGKSKTTPSANRAAAAFRMAAQSLHSSQSALGGFFRRQKARLGSPKAVTATAHKLARIFYSMLKNKTAYDAPDADYYEVQYRKRVMTNLRKRAAQMGFDLVERCADDALPCTA
ncbi:MAG: IS110 family transposase [Anderseniella sp.]|nr:IS110 family transposase [Anderseniella sp.]